MVNEEGKVVRIIDNEEEPSEEIIDKKTGKKIHKPKKKKIINEDGEVEDVEEIVEDIQSEYDEETGKKLPKKKKYKTKDGKIIKLEEPSQEIESEEPEKYSEKIDKKTKKTRTKKKMQLMKMKKKKKLIQKIILIILI